MIGIRLSSIAELCDWIGQVIGQRSLQISAKNVENSLETNFTCALHSQKFSLRDMKENILWGVFQVRDNYTKLVKINYPLMDQVKAYETLTIELMSITKRAQMLLVAENIPCKI